MPEACTKLPVCLRAPIFSHTEARPARLSLAGGEARFSERYHGINQIKKRRLFGPALCCIEGIN